MQAPLLIACLCADWCTTCQAYQTTFAEVARAHPDARFVWIDIEEHSDTLGDDAPDIDNFPTVMLLQGDAPLFFGTLLPHASTLEWLVGAAGRHTVSTGPIDPELARAVAQLGRELPAV